MEKKRYIGIDLHHAIALPAAFAWRATELI